MRFSYLMHVWFCSARAPPKSGASPATPARRRPCCSCRLASGRAKPTGTPEARRAAASTFPRVGELDDWQHKQLALCLVPKAAKKAVKNRQSVKNRAAKKKQPVQTKQKAKNDRRQVSLHWC